MTYVEHYTYRVRWSAEDDEYVATVAELPSLSWLAPSRTEAFERIQQLVKDVVADMAENGEEIPVPFADQEFKGRILLRVPPETHRELAIAAAEQGVSLNRLLSSRLAGV